ncbi:MAG: hydroxylamine reductase [Candidatus Omnitrophota bacterium]
MFCRQCEQTARGTGCNVKGVCGKNEDVAKLQDVLVHSLKAIAIYGNLARQLGVKDRTVDHFMMQGLFTTVTNVNFSLQRIAEMIYKSQEIKQKIKKLFLEEHKKKNNNNFTETLPDLISWEPASFLDGLLLQAQRVGISSGEISDDLRSLQEMLLYGLKGMAAYADHAFILGKESEEVNAFFFKALAALSNNRLVAGDYLALLMECGTVNLKCMEMLDQAHNEHFGAPVPTQVTLGVRKGPAIIVSGHDLYDLEQLLEQTKDKGINIYTHGEMLAAHGYPGLKKYKHLAGHFGTAWQNQQKEFDNIAAVILMTTNCIQEPKVSYKDRIFTTGLVAWPDVMHIEEKAGNKDFSPLIVKATQLGGFINDSIEKEITVGFGHHAVLAAADKIISAVNAGQIKHFFLIGGCDGAKPGRNYYTDFAQKVPKDCMILTLACGKFRFNRLDFGTIGVFPRLLDCGQCNDAYSAIKIAVALANAFKCSVNELPLSLILSWYEQKAVVILLTLLSLGIKNIRLGPSLPAFVSAGILKILVEQFDIKPITTADNDLKEILKAV